MARRLSKMLKVPKRFQKINWFAWVEKEKMPECKDCHTCSEEVKWDWSLTPTSPSLKYLSYFYPHVIRFASAMFLAFYNTLQKTCPAKHLMIHNRVFLTDCELRRLWQADWRRGFLQRAFGERAQCNRGSGGGAFQQAFKPKLTFFSAISSWNQVWGCRHWGPCDVHRVRAWRGGGGWVQDPPQPHP